MKKKIEDHYSIVPKPTPLVGGLRKWQAEGLKALGDSQFTFTTAPCGSGKSTFQVELAVREITRTHFQQKQLFCVPQSHIGGSFSNHSVKIGKKTYAWKVTDANTFCDSKNTVERLKAWLLTPSSVLLKGSDLKSIDRTAAVCSYATLVMAFGRMTDAEKRKAYKNLSLRIDEAHHVNGLVEDGEKATQEQNQLSQVCQDALNGLGHSTTGLHMTTATPMRGDHDVILTPKAKERFRQHTVYWDEWIEELGIKNIHFAYEDYDGLPVLHAAVIARLKKDIKAGRKVWIMIPPTGQGWRKEKTAYKPILADIGKIKGVHLQDFVPYESDRDAATHLHAEASTNVLITCAWGREGTDWVPCDTIYNTMVDGSVTVAIQKWGRPLRKFPKKDSVSLVSFVAFPKKIIKGKSVREMLSDHTNSLMASMVMGSNFTGGLLADMKALSHEPQAAVTKIETTYIEELPAAMVKGKDAVADLQEKATKQLMSLTKPPSDALRLGGFDRINQFADRLMAGTMTKIHMKQIRELLEEGYKTIGEWVKVAETLAKEHGGVLPTNTWLRKNGFDNLRQRIIMYPDDFCHVKQLKQIQKSLSSHVSIASDLAKRNGNILPNTGWLLKHGYSGTERAIRKHPHAFSHLKREKLFATLEDHVAMAKALAKNNGGVLPTSSWLQKNGHGSLDQSMRKNPQSFSQIKQEKQGGTSVVEWVKVAERLAKKNGGLLPSHLWLKQNALGALSQAMWRKSQAFAHIKQSNLRKEA